MSWLRRTGTGRNNIAWGGGSTTSGKYLRRTGTSRNSIQWLNISSNGTHNILERTNNNTNRNSIRWINTTFNFKSDHQIRVEEMFAPAIENGYLFHMGIPETGISDRYRSTECKLNDTGSSYTFTVIDYSTEVILASAFGYFIMSKKKQ